MITLGPLNDAPGIRHAFFTRVGGVSTSIYASRNCGFGSGDTPENVTRNRALCLAQLDAGTPSLVTVYQTHSADMITVEADWAADEAPRADAMVTNRPGIALGILTADCAPVILVDGGARVIGAAHAGWKGARSGIIEATVDGMCRLGADRARIVAGVGPRIGSRSYEVGPEFRDRFLADDDANAFYFAPARRPGHSLFDLGAYVAGRLERAGVGGLVLAPNDTLTEADRFFSYRRSVHNGEPDYGRCLSAVVLEG